MPRRRTTPKRPQTSRPTFFRPSLEVLEDRTLPSAAAPATTLASGASGPFTPAQIQQAYGFNQITFDNGTVQGNGSGQTIAIVVANSDPNIASDLQAFDAQFGLSNPNLVVKTFSGDGQPVGVDPTGAWEQETALDVEWAHAMAPGANILLVEASSPGQIFNAAQYAAGQPGVSVVSMSVQGPETAFESATDSAFTTPAGHQGVTFVAAAGDQGTVSYPAASPNVLAVGGTTLTLNSSGNYGSETPWSNSGGGASQFESEPSYQEGVQTTGKRTTPDVAYDANPGTGFWVYDSFNDGGNPWRVVGGTSAGAPQWAALIAIADQGRALEGLPSLDGAAQTLPMLYQASSAAFHQVPGGASPSPSGNYNQTTGLGSPYANRVAAALAEEVSGSGQTVTATVGQSFTGTVASFADYTGSGSLSALVNWGDGQTSQGQVVNEGNGQYQVVGTHTYAAAGTYTMQVQIEGSNVVTATVASTAQVAPSSQSSGSPTPTPQPTASPPATQPTTTPQVVSSAASGPSANTDNDVLLTFNEAVNPATLTSSTVALTGPSGQAIPITAITPVSGSGDKQFNVQFATQTAGGTYSLTVGPNVLDASGNAMTQAYQTTFTIIPTYTFSAPVPTSLPAGSRLAVSLIEVNQNVTIGQVSVQLNITYPQDGNLYVFLQGPDGSMIVLSNRRGGSGANFNNTTFSSQATTPIGSGQAPFPGTYEAEIPLSDLEGKNAYGTWKLWVVNLSSTDGGTINSWSLTITPSVTTATQPASIASVGSPPAGDAPTAASLSPATSGSSPTSGTGGSGPAYTFGGTTAPGLGVGDLLPASDGGIPSGPPSASSQGTTSHPSVFTQTDSVSGSSAATGKLRLDTPFGSDNSDDGDSDDPTT